MIFAIWAMLEARLAKKAISDSMPLKEFAITVGLREGYDEDVPIHGKDVVENLFKEWILLRKKDGLPIFTGMISEATLIYPVRNNGEDGQRIISEPTCQITGALSAKYDKGRSDMEVSQTLTDFARYVGTVLKQKRVYITYYSQQWVVDIA